jgi:hypothetical protein
VRRTLSIAAALALAALAFAATPAQADQTFTGTITGTEPITHILEPDHATEGCALAGGGSADAPVDTVDLSAQIAGGRRFVVTSPQAPSGEGIVFYVYRNGTCVGADYLPDDAQETAAGQVDVDGIRFAAGDRITVKVTLFVAGSWKLTVVQPEPVKGAAKAAAVGKGARFVSLPASISCANHSASVRFTKKAKRNAVKAVIKADGKKVKQVRSLKRKPVVVKRLAAGASTLSVVLTLKSGKKVNVQRSYWAC